MRWVVLVIAAACGSSKPATPKDAPVALDVPVDVAIDAPPGSGCVASAFTGSPTTIGTATALSIALPTSLAFAVSSPNDNSLYEEQPPSAAAAAIAVFTADATHGWDHPALRPDGNELFAREINTTTIWSSTKSGSTWATPVQMTGGWPSDSLASTPAAVGTAGDLRMMIWDDVQLQEYSRASGTWTSVGTAMTPTQLVGQNAFLAAPMLTPDGLSLVFLANLGGSSLTVYYLHRASTSAAWPLPATAIYASTAIYSPYLTANCADLYLLDNDKLARLGP
jgi:hypothetical protein